MRLLHMDGLETWEQKFLAGLQRVGVHPDDTAAPSNERIVRNVATHQVERTRVISSQQDAAERLLAQLRALNVRIVDNRAKGGAIWAYPNGSTVPYVELRALGMKFKSDNQGFYWP